GNLNRLLAWAHARVIENLLEQTPGCQEAVSDQFGDARLLERALLERGRRISLTQRPRAESDPVVAAASIVARAEFLTRLAALAHRGEMHTIIERYGAIDDTPASETWNSTELLYEIGRAFGMLGNEEKVERYLLRCAELAPRRAAVFHCAIGWYFQRKKKWTK